MGALERRLKNLEQAGGGMCETCAKNPISVEWTGEETEDKPCLECGKPPVVIQWANSMDRSRKEEL